MRQFTSVTKREYVKVFHLSIAASASGVNARAWPLKEVLSAIDANHSKLHRLLHYTFVHAPTEKELRQKVAHRVAELKPVLEPTLRFC